MREVSFDKPVTVESLEHQSGYLNLSQDIQHFRNVAENQNLVAKVTSLDVS